MVDLHSNFLLTGKVAVVTGGGSGIGQAIAATFAQRGCAVHILDINGESAAATAKGIATAGGNAVSAACDVTDQGQVEDAINSIARAGGLHILVNNVGIAHVGKIEDTDEDTFRQVFTVNVAGMYHCMKACIPHMKGQGGGVILNIGSIAARVGLNDRFAYSMSKGAVLAMTYSVAKDYLPYGIRCNCISPARVHTPFVEGFIRKNYPEHEQEMFEKLSHSQPVGRMAEPQEVAALALFLCSDQASFITGSDYPLDGGFLNLRG
jgi:NAD(P)-dependent dehydrogenase (short-subunit alcohol dehydrogenase family)